MLATTFNALSPVLPALLPAAVTVIGHAKLDLRNLEHVAESNRDREMRAHACEIVSAPQTLLEWSTFSRRRNL